MVKKIINFIFIIVIFFFFKFKYNLINIEVGFSPGKTAENIILKSINNSKKTIDIAAYSFTNKPIAILLNKAYNRGVKIRVVVDKKSNTGKYTIIKYLRKHNIKVKLNNKYSIMHNKFMIIDNNSVETGSFNYTNNAIYRNAENVILIKNIYNITKIYKNEFNILWKESIKF
ncbi:phospholipase D family protein [Enterobacteriaceae bacterium ET-AT1-13]|nr:phospholipase D family protein [Enterobacteriaceae bacterium ET-AT1-13]WGS66420.1 phospholipase D family protein [Enterobacteriaceae bacterium Cmel17]WMC17444.1 MAG: phospholipase D family protein [Enterobacteriaceae bacterium Cmel21]WMC17651.1 MAG: phospholipase D family protein [Enterobacteriaceae bacterium PSmelAO3-2]WMC17855.1 MAG: phospholipase D family protein [Enterobacteriaceae bacterium PSmelAO3-1]WMC18059.1 MAG: phospholipase D family protein [Enterobacteriaceae bacterium PSmelAO1